MMINDGRACTKAMNEMLNSHHKEPRFAVLGSHVVTDAYLFGHYDSRGGTTMLVGEPEQMKAMILYNRVCGWPDLGSAPVEDMLHTGAAEIHFVGGAPNESRELDFAYEGVERGYLYGRVQTRYWRSPYGEGEGQWSEWEDVNAWVFWRVPKNLQADTEETQAIFALWEDDKVDAQEMGCPEISLRKLGILTTDVRIRRDSLGEDACGVVYQDVSNVKLDPISTNMEW
jgi:hypothetical protein